jgi:hypothetical protein
MNMNKTIYSVIMALPLLISGAIAQGQVEGRGQGQEQTNNVAVYVLGSGRPTE